MKANEMKIVVSEVRGGWTVRDGYTQGPFSKERAIDLAQGMVAALREHSEEPVELVIDGEIVRASAPK